MAKFKKVVLPLSQIKANQQNPRIISESKLKKLINSLLVFPKMLSLRPITVEDDYFVLGGNMRQTALGRIAQMNPDEIKSYIVKLPEYQVMTEDEQEETVKFWLKFIRKPMVEVQVADGLTDEEKQQFIIKDNVSFGDWDYDELENWDSDKLEAWGVDAQLPDFGDGSSDWGGQNSEKKGEIKETEKLSEVKFYDVYYTPKNTPNINLRECVNLDLFEKKLDVIKKSSLTDEQKDVMKLLAYRFIKIDFESVANYYAFNASEEEKRIIERLRCVLVDGSIDGFIEDEMLKVLDHFENEENENQESEEND